MQMYKYYQVGEKSGWLPTPEDSGLEERLKKLKAIKCTILSLSETIGDTTEQSSISYKGPLFFDIDYKEDLAVAIASTQTLVNRLLDLDVPADQLRIVCSGSKGLHVKISEKLFSTGRPVKGLPLIYMEMAKELHVTGLDFQVYNQGRGTSWRLENVERSNGCYPVPITLEELGELTPDSYKEIVKAPRDLPWNRPETYKDNRSVGLFELYDRCRKLVRAKPSRDHTAVTDDNLIKIRDVTPACITELVDYNIKDTYNFNQVALQLAAYVARTGLENDGWEPMVSRMAEVAHSSQYDSPRSRYAHLSGMISYARKAPALSFSCRAMRGLLITSVCEGCPLNSGEDGLLEEGIGVCGKSDGYYQLGAKSDTRISTFVLEPVSVHLKQDQETGQYLRVATDFEMIVDGVNIATKRFDEGSWAGRSTFLKELEGVANLSFVGTDTDVQRIKHLIYTEDREMGEITQVETAGIHNHRVGDRSIRVYVEPGFSISELRAQGTHRLVGDLSAPPRMRDFSIVKAGDTKVADALNNLMRSNGQIEVAQILGWFVASHSKLAFMQKWNQFPLLSLWGGAGVGKSKTATMFSRLSGCDFRMQDSPMTLGSISRFAIVHHCSGTTSVPRLLDEYNPSKMSRELYNYCGEVLKAAWGGSVVSRGTVARKVGQSKASATAYDIPISAPLLIMSEQAPESPALVQRSIQVMLTRSSREGCETFFNAAEDTGPELFMLAKALMTQALTIKPEWIYERMAHWATIVPRTLDDRPRFSFQVILTGLDLLALCCAGLKLPVLDYIEEITNTLADYLFDSAVEMNKRKSFSEIDGVIEDLGVIIALQAEDGAKILLVHGKHYLARGDMLFIDPITCISKYKSYKRSISEVPVIKSAAQFCSLIKDEPYYRTMVVCEEMGLHRQVLQLDMNRLEAKALDRSLFEGG